MSPQSQKGLALTGCKWGECDCPILVERLRNGDQDAVAELLKNIDWKIREAIKGRTKNDPTLDTDDLLSNAYEKLFVTRVAILKWQPEKELCRWLTTVVTHLVVDSWRHRHGRNPPTVPFPTIGRFVPMASTPQPDEVVEKAELLAKARLVVSELPERTKEVFEMWLMDKMSLKDISEKLGVHLNTVTTHRNAALKAIKFRLEEDS